MLNRAYFLRLDVNINCNISRKLQISLCQVQLQLDAEWHGSKSPWGALILSPLFHTSLQDTATSRNHHVHHHSVC